MKQLRLFSDNENEFKVDDRVVCRDVFSSGPAIGTIVQATTKNPQILKLYQTKFCLPIKFDSFLGREHCINIKCVRHV